MINKREVLDFYSFHTEYHLLFETFRMVRHLQIKRLFFDLKCYFVKLM